jgi:hypothetical protein
LELGAKELTAPVWKEQSGVMESGLEQFVAASLELPLESLEEASFSALAELAGHLFPCAG